MIAFDLFYVFNKANHIHEKYKTSLTRSALVERRVVNSLQISQKVNL